MFPDAIVPVSMVGAVQVHMVAVHVGDNVVLHIHKSINGPYSSPTQAPLHNPPWINHGGSANC